MLEYNTLSLLGLSHQIIDRVFITMKGGDLSPFSGSTWGLRAKTVMGVMIILTNVLQI